jgi:transcriptional regulator GlxA family with amidase domain
MGPLRVGFIGYEQANALDLAGLFIKDGPFYTSAGVTAGIDLARAMIEEDFGSKIALTPAREMVVYLKRHRQGRLYISTNAPPVVVAVAPRKTAV